MSTILVVDDVAAMRDQYAYDLKRLGGHTVLTAAGGDEALEILEREAVHCVILDLEMPHLDGFEVLKALASRGNRVPVIVYTGTGDYERCVRAVKLGASSFIDKAEPVERVVLEVGNTVERARLEGEVTMLKRRLGDDSALVGTSRAMAALDAAIAKLAPIPSPVLVLGESGTGKELVARELHRRSGRSRAPYVTVNCAALPENLIESELFGHERGAFTGADRLRVGAFEAANGGSLFLDEIGDLPALAQAKLLRVLEEQVVTRLGGLKPIRIDTRIVAATHRDLESEAAAGRMREDLLFRLNAHVIRVPPLRERLSDLPALVDHLLARTCERFRVRPKRVSEEALDRLMRHDWRRNNVRELRNVVERMVLAAEGEEIGADHVPSELQAASPAAAGSSDSPHPARSARRPTDAPTSLSLRQQKANAEREIVLAALERNGWQITKTAAELGLADHASLLKVMKRHGLKRK
jgi:two-component system nitrogen regulation response regulator NtrX